MEEPDWVSILVDRIPLEFFVKSMGYESGKGEALESILVDVSRVRV
jgi:hypothetical protein